MPNLEISIHCLCLFVPDPDESVMHVLMPRMHDNHPHFLNVCHTSFPDGREMKGWILRLGDTQASAATDFQPVEPTKNHDMVFDISTVGGRVPRKRIGNPEAVVSRLELRSGRIKSMNATATCVLNGKRVAATSRVTWMIEDINDAQLSWDRLGKPSTDRPPFATIADLTSDEREDLIELELFHVSHWPPSVGGDLTPEDLKHHFAGYYHLCDVHHPTRDQLPQDPEMIGRVVEKEYRIPSYICTNARSSFM